MRHNIVGRGTSVTAWAASAALLGCAVGPDFVRPPAPDTHGYTSQATLTTTVVAGNVGQRFASAQDVAADWWRLFASPELDGIVVASIAANPSLDAARAALRRSHDSLLAGYGVFFPALDAHAGVSRQKYNPAPGALPSNEFNLFTLSGGVSYSLDLWGGQRRQVEVLGAEEDAQRYTLAATYIMLSSNIVNTVIAEAAYRAEIEATQASISLQREQLRITEAQARAGTAPYSTVLSVQSQIASTEATLPTLEDKVDQAADLLAALAGRTPAEWKQPAIALTTLKLPSDLPLSVPSKLVRQRPDVLEAEAGLHAATANIGVATAAMLPNLTLSAGYGVNNTSAADLFGPASVLWNLGAGVTQPIFHGGALWYQRKAALDARDESFANYRETVLAAFEQVADTLRGLEHGAETLRAETEAVETAEGALALMEANYQAGVANYLQVLVADGQYLQAKIGFIQAQAQRLQETVALYVALGGGWWNVPSLVKSPTTKTSKG